MYSLYRPALHCPQGRNEYRSIVRQPSPCITELTRSQRWYNMRLPPRNAPSPRFNDAKVLFQSSTIHQRSPSLRHRTTTQFKTNYAAFYSQS
jgi:hypothetical protein